MANIVVEVAQAKAMLCPNFHVVAEGGAGEDGFLGPTQRQEVLFAFRVFERYSGANYLKI
eukprot:m.163946 g.163946  ORF g.163946 m.163946 type:complete len:60 (+) comp24928_c0_seq2:80-259(+)